MLGALVSHPVLAQQVDYSCTPEPWQGDFDGMPDRRMLPIGAPHSMMHCFLDGASEYGIATAMGRQPEPVLCWR
jgi:hypothetical protein